MEPGSRIAHFEIVGLVGAGGMGEVYRARDTRLGRDVAIKVLPPELASDPGRLRRFEQEARAVAALNHPHILAIHDMGTHEGMPYIVTELLTGESLADRLGDGAIPVRSAVEIGVQIARGLAAAHDKGVIHRDLKPGNVFVTQDGHVKILDFGLAKLAGERVAREPAQAKTAVGATEVGTTVGTVGYMSPEQVRGASLDARSDIFSFGCVLYEMVFGKKAFAGATRADTLSAILHTDPPGLEGPAAPCPGPLREILRRCLEKRAGDRYSSARDVALALQAAASSDPAALPVPAPPGRRTWVWIAGAVVAGLAVAAALLWTGVGRFAARGSFHTRQVTGQLPLEGRISISPRGDEVAYALEDQGKSAIWITDIRGGSPLRLTKEMTRAADPAWFADGGAIAFTADEGGSHSIWRVPRLGGTAMPLLPDAEDAALSPDGRRIAFSRRAEEGFLRIWVASLPALDDAHRITGPDDGLFDHEGAAWSPDSSTICYSDARDLWVTPAAGGGARPLMKDDSGDSQPVWSADGTSIYFASTRDDTLALWRIPAAGGEAVRVTGGTGSERFPSVSRDGRNLAFASRHLTGGVALADLRTGRIARVREGTFCWLPAIAPDGSALVFVSRLGEAETLRSVTLKDGAPVGDSVALVDQPGEVVSPAFSPDGRWVAYYSAVNGQREVEVVSARGGSPVNFSGDTAQDLQPVWSPDSTKIAFVSNRGGAYQIWVAPFAEGRRGGEPVQITHDASAASYPSWSPDGKTIAYLLHTDKGEDVWTVPADGGGPSRRLTAGADAGCLRWFGASGDLLVNAFWGQSSRTLRRVSLATGETRPLPVPGSLGLHARVVDFDLSRDAGLLALFEGRTESVIWVREAREGSF